MTNDNRTCAIYLDEERTDKHVIEIFILFASMCNHIIHRLIGQSIDLVTVVVWASAKHASTIAGWESVVVGILTAAELIFFQLEKPKKPKKPKID